VFLGFLYFFFKRKAQKIIPFHTFLYHFYAQIIKKGKFILAYCFFFVFLAQN